MRILHVIGYYEPNFFYREVYYTNFLAENNEVYILTSNRGFPHVHKKINQYDVGFFREGKINLIRKNPFWQIKDIINFSFKRDIEEIRPDIVHVYDSRQYITYRVAKYCLKNRIPVVIEQEQRILGISKPSILISKIFINRWLKNIVNKVQLIRVATPGALNYLKKNCGLTENSNSFVCTLGFDEKTSYYSSKERKEYRHQLDLNDNELVIGISGKFDPSKKIEVIIRALESLKRKDIILIIVGVASPEYTKYIENLVSKNLKIYFINRLMDKIELNKFYNAIDYAIWTKPTIGFFEALGTNTKVIIPYAEGTNHLKSDNILFYGREQGLNQELSNIEDNDLIKKEITNIFENLEYYDKLICEDCLKFSCKHISIELEEQYKKILRKWGPDAT